LHKTYTFNKLNGCSTVLEIYHVLFLVSVRGEQTFKRDSLISAKLR